MDNIASHAKKLAKKHERTEEAHEIIKSAKHLAKLVLRDDLLHTKHKKSVLSLVQWLLSGADGKYSTRFRSRRVVELARNFPTSTEPINHEHVFSRAERTERLLEVPTNINEIDKILNTVVACVVTKEEHEKLGKGQDGWERYTRAGVEVLDMSTEPPTLRNPRLTTMP